MHAFRLTAILFLSLFFVQCGVREYKSTSKPVNHAIWDSLLQKHVSDDGWVDYIGFREDSSELNKYLDLLSNNHPNKKFWSDDEQLAYWINAYNAFTVKLVADNYPVKSIKDIKDGIPFVNTVWDIKFIHIEGATYDLNNIEHGIIRKQFKEPRIHFAVNCASVSCPPLLNHAFTAEKLDQQLDSVARGFINGNKRNQLDAQNPKLSKIFSWFSGDFEKVSDSVRDFINQYADIQIEEGADLEYLEYYWELNEASNKSILD
ncbi:MAG: DUF547 domain-containing protein [Saprospiraceae bacterium]|nr:DUF547 domain-containing protein [Saprospiraceae bacterium]